MRDRLAQLWKLRRVRWPVQAVGLLLVYLAFHAYQTRDLVSGQAPGLEATTVSGQTASLAGHAGKPVVVHFWATWCGVCKAEEGAIDSVARDETVITVATRSGTQQSVSQYLQEQGLEFDAVNDPRGDIARSWGVRAFPTTFVVAPDGSIASRTVGYTTSWGLRLRVLFSAF